MRLPLAMAISGCMLVACGGKDSSTNPDTNPENQLTSTPPSTAPLVEADATRVSNHLKNGIRLQLQNGFLSGNRGGQTSAPEAAPSSDSAASGTGNYSQTNVHVAGVDEADYSKYDGRHWFVATSPASDPYLVDTQSRIQIVATDPVSPGAEILTEITIDESTGSLDGMYLVNGDDAAAALAVLQNEWGSIHPWLPSFPAITRGVAELTVDRISLPYPVNGKARVSLYDVTDASAPQLSQTIEVDGTLIDSRKLDNTLYLVTRFDPWLDSLSYDGTDGAASEDNEQLLAAADLDDLMPRYRNGTTGTPLSDNCLLQADTADSYGFGSLINITAIDLASGDLVGSVCINSNLASLSMSQDALYLTGTVYSDGPSDSVSTRTENYATVIHKFDLTRNGPVYAATGSVAGHLGWSSDPAFRLHEYNGDLRVVTSNPLERELEHKFFLLEQNGGSLDVVAELPNRDQPAAIGKPGEDIYAVRFQEDYAYIVTFERTDPLYKLDLSDRTAPRIAGELEIPGFSTYLHPLNENYLFSLGHDADDQGMTRGIKAELVDVSGDDPRIVDTVLLGGAGTYSEALQNLRALTLLPVDASTWRIAFPVDLHESTDSQPWGKWTNSGLQLLEIQGIDGTSAGLTDAGFIQVEMADGDSQWPSWGSQRAIMHNDAVFYAHNTGIWAALWNAPKEAQGPIQLPLICTAVVIDGLDVTVNSANNESLDACDAVVTAIDQNSDYREVLAVAPDSADDPSQCRFTGLAERAGSYIVETALGDLPGTSEYVTVFRDRCHVIPTELTVNVPGEDVVCTLEVRPSIHLYLSTGEGANPCAATVVATHNGNRYPLDSFAGSGDSGGGSDSGPAPDRPAGAVCEFSGPDELAGDLSLEISLPGFEPQSLDVYVPRDECHVHTQYIDARLTPIQ